MKKSILQQIKDFNLVCFLIGHKYNRVRPLNSLKIFKSSGVSKCCGGDYICSSCGRHERIFTK